MSHPDPENTNKGKHCRQNSFVGGENMEELEGEDQGWDYESGMVAKLELELEKDQNKEMKKNYN